MNQIRYVSNTFIALKVLKRLSLTFQVNREIMKVGWENRKPFSTNSICHLERLESTLDKRSKTPGPGI